MYSKGPFPLTQFRNFSLSCVLKSRILHFLLRRSCGWDSCRRSSPSARRSLITPTWRTRPQTGAAAWARRRRRRRRPRDSSTRIPSAITRSCSANWRASSRWRRGWRSRRTSPTSWAGAWRARSAGRSPWWCTASTLRTSSTGSGRRNRTGAAKPVHVKIALSDFVSLCSNRILQHPEEVTEGHLGNRDLVVLADGVKPIKTDKRIHSIHVFSVC